MEANGDQNDTKREDVKNDQGPPRNGVTLDLTQQTSRTSALKPERWPK